MNQAVFLGLLQPGDTFMGLDLSAGGHLTHGSPVNMSGKWFKVVPYGVRREDQLLDMEHIEKLAKEHKPKLITAGGSAYASETLNIYAFAQGFQYFNMGYASAVLTLYFALVMGTSLMFIRLRRAASEAM